MDKPLTQWYCDVCGEKIEKAEDGYVVWGHDPEDSLLDKGFKIIHWGKCDDNRLPSSAALPDFLGADGLINLTRFLSIGTILCSHGQGRTSAMVADINEFADFMRRVQIPY